MTIDLEELMRLAKNASPGPWEWWTSNSVLRLTGGDRKDGGVLHGYVRMGGYGDVAASEQNQAYIAAANPAAVLELIDHIAELERENQRLSVECSKRRED